MPAPAVPEASKNIRFTLRSLQIEGMTAFTPAQVRDSYAEYLDGEITLDVLWIIAGRLTERYQQAGYFLSRVYVPAHEISDGHVMLRAVEGYIQEIALDKGIRLSGFVDDAMQLLQRERPLHVDTLESVLLRLNDLPGTGFRAVLEKPTQDDAPEGATRLNLKVVAKDRISGRTSFDNYGSRFLGPNELTQQLSAVVIPGQRTNLTLLGATELDELAYYGLSHEVPLNYRWSMDLSASRTATSPGFNLEPQDIDSVSSSAGIGVTYHAIRQRQEILNARVALDLRNTESDLLDGLAPLTRDYVRAARTGLTYQAPDGWQGANLISATVSKGLGIFGASDKGDLNLSRIEADPEFTKLEFAYSRLQRLNDDWSLLASMAGQVASGPLLSNEEFGYGGQAFGKAYDSSEVIGDHGLAAALEIRYSGLPAWKGISAVPYAFYDAGVVWNDDTTQDNKASGSAAGAGMRVASDIGITTNLGLAFPLTRDIATPIHGNDQGPRYMIQLSYDY